MLDAFGQGFLFFCRPVSKDIVYLVAGREFVADTEPQAGKCLVAEDLNNIVQPVMSGITTPGPEPESAERKGKIIGNDQEVLLRDF